MRAWGTTLGAAVLLAVGCSFHPGGGAGSDGDGDGDGDGSSVDAATSVPAGWWDDAYRLRIPLAIAAGPSAPEGGYAGYTARLVALDSRALIDAGDLRADCRDLRLLRWSEDAWSEIDRHLVGCGGPATDLRFALAADIAPGATDGTYYLYLGNPDATAPTPLRTDNVYLWYDDARQNRSSQYERGRLDSWGSTNNWVDTLTWSEGAYEYVRGDDQVSSYRRAVGERDVYVEAHLFHTACFPGNMATGLVVRGVIANGSDGTEEAEHYYASMRAQQSTCGGGYAFDGDIVASVRDLTAVDGENPPAVATGAWRAQALAAWGAGPTHLAFWDLDAAWPAPGWPPSEALVSSGDHQADHQGPGFAGIWMAQDAGRFRGLLIRRYVDPEPAVTAGPAESRD